MKHRLITLDHETNELVTRVRSRTGTRRRPFGEPDQCFTGPKQFIFQINDFHVNILGRQRLRSCRAVWGLRGSSWRSRRGMSGGTEVPNQIGSQYIGRGLGPVVHRTVAPRRCYVSKLWRAQFGRAKPQSSASVCALSAPIGSGGQHRDLGVQKGSDGVTHLRVRDLP